MAQLTDFEQARKRRARRRMTRNLVVLAFFGLVVYLCVTLIQRAGELDLKTAYSDIKSEIGSGGGYPVAMPGGRILEVRAAGDTVMLLSDTNIYGYNSTGKQTLNEQHGMGARALSVARDRALVYDRGGTKLALYSKSALVKSISADFPVLTADLAVGGNFAVATGSDTHLAEVTVYNKNMEWFYRWRSLRPVISVALSDVRDEMAVGCVDVSDGSYLSSVSRFLLSTKKEFGRVELPGELLLRVDYAKGNSLRAITDQRVLLFNSDMKQVGSYSFNGRVLDRYYHTTGGMVLVFGDYAADKQLEVVILDAALEPTANLVVKYDINDLKADANYVYLASRDHIEILKMDGTPAVSLPVSSLHYIEPVGDLLYYTTNTELSVADVKVLTAPKSESSPGNSASGPADSSQGSESPSDGESSPEDSESEPGGSPADDGESSGDSEGSETPKAGGEAEPSSTEGASASAASDLKQAG